jgi:hypothetical protein
MPWTLQTQSKNHQRWAHSAILANATNSTDSLAIGAFQQLDLQVLHATMTDTASYGTDWSNDGGTTWERAGAVLTTSGASGSTSRSVDGMPGALFRITVTETDANAASNLTAYVTLKKKG